MLSGDDFDAEIAERYGWVNRTVDDDGLNLFVDTLVRRLVSFDRETLAAAKGQINRFGCRQPPSFSRATTFFFRTASLARCAGAPCEGS